MPKPVKISSKRPTSVPNKVSEVEAAEAAVQLFEDEYQRLDEMTKDFARDYPDAGAALVEIKRQEDVVQDAIARAHPLVQVAKQDVGPFTCQRKWKQAHYDEAEFTRLAVDLDPDELHKMLVSGHIKKMALDKSVTGYLAQNPDVANVVQPAWREKVEMTPAVTAPKI